jgi:glucose-6-phosphate isomerase, archaeal
VNHLIAAVNWADGALDVPGRRTSEKKLGQLSAIFRDKQALQTMDPGTVVYRVWWWEAVPLGTEGGLLWGLTEIQPGCVGDEYYMTHGHRHAIANRSEFYGTSVGAGLLVLRGQSGQAWSEEMKPGSLHYVPAGAAHRVVNTGDGPLRFIACWPSDAGYDYELTGSKGFGARVFRQNDRPVFTLTEE